MRIARLLLERISLRGVCRAVGVGSDGFYTLCERFQAGHEYLYVTSQSGTQTVILPRLEIELLFDIWLRTTPL
jgi:hypothetical protein